MCQTLDMEHDTHKDFWVDLGLTVRKVLKDIDPGYSHRTYRRANVWTVRELHQAVADFATEEFSSPRPCDQPHRTREHQERRRSPPLRSW